METQKGPRGTAECSRYLVKASELEGGKAEKKRRKEGEKEEIKMVLEY